MRNRNRYTLPAIIASSVLLLLALCPRLKYWHVRKPISLATYRYPEKNGFDQERTRAMLDQIDKDRVSGLLTELDNTFKTRHYNSVGGHNFALNIYERLMKLTESDPETYQVRLHPHLEWKQPSVIFRIIGEHNKTLVVGCHLDSLSWTPFASAPGVDDDLTGVVALFEAAYVISSAEFRPVNSVEFHFYAAEEVGMKGSLEVYEGFAHTKRDIVGHLQQDMAGFTLRSKDNGGSDHFGVVTDYESPSLMQFVTTLITEYCDIDYRETKCSRVCSDHSAALLNGYPAVYVLESEVELSNPYIHGNRDTIDLVDFEHLNQHVKLVIAFVSELGMAKELEMPTPFHNRDTVTFSLGDLVILSVTAEPAKAGVICLLVSVLLASMLLTCERLYQNSRLLKNNISPFHR